ncbi:hypothetical protein [Paraburkholderia sp.]|uniref:hypothetical protein n=1 Tax=Paraburkholderia sp. TaxID=1926495 RepID=UPI00286F3CF5|nr:hypothetical protein [Paraburkholderia sp.]
MASVNRRRAPGRGVGGPPRWSKQWLLPMPHASVRSLSLNAHLALEACRAERGNQHMLNELTRLTYLSFFMWEAGVGHAQAGVYADVEDVLNVTVEHAVRSGQWIVSADDVAAIEALLKVYDEQLSSVTARVYCDAVQRLDRLLATPQTVSPLVRKMPRETAADISM